MANETTLEKPTLPLIEPLMNESEVTADTPANGTEPSEVGPYYDHWTSVVGAFKDDPTFDEMMQIIRQRRREMDADDTIL